MQKLSNYCLHLPPYNANAKTNPPTIASPPLANLATAAFGVSTGGADVCEPPDVVGDGPRVVVKVFEIVRLELGLGIEKLEVFALVDVEMTVTVEEGTEDVVVAA